MKKVITYGTFDLIHLGHIRLLERAKALGDYLIVGVTSDDFDKSRGKINVQQNLIERIENVKATGLADEIIVEEYEGQKIDDICRNNVDIFAIGTDWLGKFDYLKDYCEVVYLERTKGISSSDIRTSNNKIRFGLVGDAVYLNKMIRESRCVNGIEVSALCSNNVGTIYELQGIDCLKTKSFDDILKNTDALYIHSKPVNHFDEIKQALVHDKHVLCESPITLSKDQTTELFALANERNLVLLEAIKTAYATAFSRMILLVKSGVIGDVVSIDSTCTSLSKDTYAEGWNGLNSWGPVALLPVFKILGVNYDKVDFTSFKSEETDDDLMTHIDFVFPTAIASVKVGRGIKSEGQLIITGTKGYIFVPAPWWKTEYFEIRYEKMSDTKKLYYQLEGEGIRNEIVSFSQNILGKNKLRYIESDISIAISKIMQKYNEKNDVKTKYLGAKK